MNVPDTARIDAAAVEIAPDGSRVHPLLALESGSMAQFELDGGQVSRAVRHRSVEEIWLVLSGRGEIWRRGNGQESTVPLAPGVCVAITRGTAFQFRCIGDEALRIIAVTMPPWPGNEEALLVPGKWC